MHISRRINKSNAYSTYGLSLNREYYKLKPKQNTQKLQENLNKKINKRSVREKQISCMEQGLSREADSSSANKDVPCILRNLQVY
jgi:hypothetical protein